MSLVGRAIVVPARRARAWARDGESRRRSALAALLMIAAGSMVAVPAAANGLLQAWRAAQQHDLDYVAAQAAHEAALARRGQAASLWRPSVNLSATAGRGTSETSIRGARFSTPALGTSNGVDFDTSVRNGNSWRVAIQASQPLFDRERDAQKRQIELSIDAGELQWQAARQSSMLRTADAWFDAALAAQALRVLQQQQGAVEHALAEARDRYALGSAPVTDTHEAAARAQTLRAQVLAAQAQLEIQRSALSDITGWDGSAVPVLDLEQVALPDEPTALATWLDEVRAGNLGSRMQQRQAEVARQEAAKYTAAAAPKVALVAQFAQDRIDGSGAFGAAGAGRKDALIGVQLTMPLFTGGWRDAKHDEARWLIDKARAESERSAQQATQQARSAWLGLTTGAARARALADALTAARSRLDATQLGRQVGDRTTLDLLNAQNDAAAAELELLRARVSLLRDRLRLAALAGRLDESELMAVDAGLGKQATGPIPGRTQP